MNTMIDELVFERNRLWHAFDIAMASLNTIASWPEGLEVNPSFDEPASAKIARDALEQIRKALDLGHGPH